MRRAPFSCFLVRGIFPAFATTDACCERVCQSVGRDFQLFIADDVVAIANGLRVVVIWPHSVHGQEVAYILLCFLA